MKLPAIEDIARELHLARLRSCYFKQSIPKGQKGHWSTFEAALEREPFPEIGTKEQRELMHSGAPWIEIAMEQAKAVRKMLIAST